MIDTVALNVLGGCAAQVNTNTMKEDANYALNMGEVFIEERRIRKALWETPNDEKGTE